MTQSFSHESPQPPGRTLIVGDVHGHLRALEALLAAVRPMPPDRLVFLGDYVNGGPDSAEVLERLIALQQTHGAICLRGNHDDVFDAAMRSEENVSGFVMLGGQTTLASYPGGSAAGVPAAHREFLKALPLSWHDERVICVHAGIEPHEPPESPAHVQALWGHIDFARPHGSGRTVLCGHASQDSGVPLDLGHTICIDTDIKGGGWLTALDARTWTYTQSDKHGCIRTGALRTQAVGS